MIMIMLEKMMDNGLLIFEEDSKFVLKKIPTPKNPDTTICDDIVPDASRITFGSYDLAFEKALSILKEKDPEAFISSDYLTSKHSSEYINKFM